MNKAQLIEAITYRGGDLLTPTQAVEIVFDAIVRAVVAGEPVLITGFGTLLPQDRPARTVRNPHTGEPMNIPASRVARFRPGARFQDLLTERRPMPPFANCIKKDPKTRRP